MSDPLQGRGRARYVGGLRRWRGSMRGGGSCKRGGGKKIVVEEKAGGKT